MTGVLHPAHPVLSLVVDRVLLLGDKLRERWGGYVSIEVRESLHHPERGGIEFAASANFDPARPEQLFAPTYRVDVDFDAGTWHAELVCEWINGEVKLGEVRYRSGPDATDDALASLVAGNVVGWLLLDDAKLGELEQKAVERLGRKA